MELRYQGYIYGGLLVAESAAERHFAANRTSHDPPLATRPKAPPKTT